MAVNPLASSISSLLMTEPAKNRAADAAGSGSGFADILKETMNTVTETEAVDDIATAELLTGQSDDLSGILVDAEKASIALEFALQIRNKVVESYNSLTSMQV